ncbi:hypothetical protein CVJ36_06685 [Salmonella enterica subsp. enterica serovar Oranienburg]|nr:hypothetical protein CVJ36_06685 [Salmonella enterica subsp. enterica serovar Oranienburg]
MNLLNLKNTLQTSLVIRLTFYFINNNNYLAAICAYCSLYINGSETAAYNRGLICSIRDEYCTKQSTI